MIIYLVLLLLLLGSTLVFYSISPYYAAVGLVLTALFGCILLSIIGLSFVALLLLLIYMGGMLVVFIYSSALSADRFPEVSNFMEVIVLFSVLSVWVYFLFSSIPEGPIISSSFISVCDLVALSSLFSEGGLYLLIGGLALLVVLIVALVLSRGSSAASLRHI